MSGFDLLLVEDDDAGRRELAAELSARDHRVTQVRKACEAADAMAGRRFDAAIVDRMLPDGDAMAHLERWRDEGMTLPVLLLTGLVDVSDRVAGLDAGADDYLIKPASALEVDARLRALMRRARHADVEAVIHAGGLTIDRLKREVRRAGRRIFLQPRELRILEELTLAKGDVVSRTMLLKAVWDLRFDPKTKLLETHISRLRDKLDSDGELSVIETVRGEGYRLKV